LEAENQVNAAAKAKKDIENAKKDALKKEGKWMTKK